MAWVFTPYEGFLDIRFGQGREEIERLLGEPQKVKQTRTGRTRLEYGMTMPAFVFDNGGLNEMNLLPDVSELLEYKGMDLFSLPEDEVLRHLQQDDPNVRESNGFVIFFGLGLALTGFHDEMPEQKAITVFGPDHPWIAKRPAMQAISFL